ncbi:molecular chaperone DnaJ [Bacillus pseudomycoides]|uniref:molecular chaperone DnaJ n=1 Tax=Bacillus pseudomycoides TaxID=64104 RepID=UPI000BEF7F4F|nr:molecular chaperone DnaJ [Bacillus pseudomycoides]PEK34080.1 molecular chaperone DnaJ [Bacillus pseudomycoides]
MKFFQNVFTLEQLKKEYKRLAKVHHPDCGGDHKNFIALKNEYDMLFKQLNKGNEKADTFKNIIDVISKYNVDIEIIGTWIWVSGSTYPIKEELKKLKFAYSRKKKAWYFYEGEYKKGHRKNFTMEEIREMHGVQQVKKQKSDLKIEA